MVSQYVAMAQRCRNVITHTPRGIFKKKYYLNRQENGTHLRKGQSPTWTLLFSPIFTSNVYSSCFTNLVISLIFISFSSYLFTQLVHLIYLSHPIEPMLIRLIKFSQTFSHFIKILPILKTFTPESSSLSIFPSFNLF